MKKIIFAILMIKLIVICTFAQGSTSNIYQGVVWSPDGKYLSFTIMQMTNTKPMTMKADVYVMKADGTELKKITGDERNEFAPAWSKDGKRIFFGASVDGSRESNIFAISPDGTNLIQLTKNKRRNTAPSVSPDGTKVVFNSESVPRKPQIHVMDAEGSNQKALTNDDTLAFYNPLWSPDGKKIVYYVEKGDSKDQIYSMNADGTNQTLLTGGIAHNFYPSWSADGKQIIFCSNRDGENQVIYSMNADGTNIKRLLKTNSSFARYSPDGKRLAFISGKFPNYSIFVADADGSNEVNLTAKK